MGQATYRCEVHEVDCEPVHKPLVDFEDMGQLLAWRCPVDGRTFPLRPWDRGRLITLT